MGNNVVFCPDCRYMWSECRCGVPDPFVEQLKRQAYEWRLDMGISDEDQRELASAVFAEYHAKSKQP